METKREEFRVEAFFSRQILIYEPIMGRSYAVQIDPEPAWRIVGPGLAEDEIGFRSQAKALAIMRQYEAEFKGENDGLR